jgi:hypothetical protein
MATNPQNEINSGLSIIRSPQPSNSELTTTFYNAARGEIIYRLSTRETTFLAWITVIGAILSFAAKSSGSPGLLFEPRHLELIPPLCLPFSLAIFRHSLVIRYIGEYLGRELCGHLRQAGPIADRTTQDAPTHWDNSLTLSQRIRPFLAIEASAYTFFLVGVPIFCLAYLRVAAHDKWSDPWLIVGGISTAIAAFVGFLQVRLALGKF